MKFKKILICAGFLALVITGCKKNNDNPGNTGPTGSTGTTGVTGTTGNTNTTAYAVTETFESGTKTAYADASVNLVTGSWDFNDALIGNSASDAKDGTQSVRLRTGDIAMNFDVNGVTQISIKHAKYGTDAAGSWTLLQSTDAARTIRKLAPSPKPALRL